jgi:hypothetical protein
MTEVKEATQVTDAVRHFIGGVMVTASALFLVSGNGWLMAVGVALSIAGPAVVVGDDDYDYDQQER